MQVMKSIFDKLQLNLPWRMRNRRSSAIKKKNKKKKNKMNKKSSNTANTTKKYISLAEPLRKTATELYSFQNLHFQHITIHRPNNKPQQPKTRFFLWLKTSLFFFLVWFLSKSRELRKLIIQLKKPTLFIRLLHQQVQLHVEWNFSCCLSSRLHLPL